MTRHNEGFPVMTFKGVLAGLTIALALCTVSMVKLWLDEQKSRILTSRQNPCGQRKKWWKTFWHPCSPKMRWVPWIAKTICIYLFSLTFLKVINPGHDNCKVCWKWKHSTLDATQFKKLNSYIRLQCKLLMTRIWKLFEVLKWIYFSWNFTALSFNTDKKQRRED